MITAPRRIGGLVLIHVWTAAALAQVPVTTIVDPGFEAGAPGIAVNSPWVQISGFGPMYVATTGSTGLLPGDPTAAQTGLNFLTANRQLPEPDYPTNQNMGVMQDVDLTPYAHEINLGGRQMNLSFAYNDNDPNDTAVVAYRFYDGVGSPLGNTFTFTAGSAGTGAWATTSLLGEIPIGASSMRLSLQTAFNNVGTVRNISFDSVSASIQPPPPPAAPSGLVNGNLIQFDSEGAWTWYSDERAIVDPHNGRVLVNSVGFSPTVGGGSPGNVDLVEFDPATGRRVRTRLSNQQPGNPNIQNDDHNNGSLLVLPDGRYLAMYANHGNNGGLGDEFSRWRRSIHPGDSTSWTTEQLFNWYNAVPGANQTGNPDAANVSYHNLFYLSAENQVYNISRSYGRLSTNGGSQNMPNIMRYDMDSNSVQWAGQLLESEAQGYSAYPKYASNGVDRIYFTSTETHPRNFNNSIYSGYIENGQTFDMLGQVIDENLFDNGTAAGGAGFVPDVTDFTVVQAADPLGQGHNRLWTVDMNLDAEGSPMSLFISRWNPDGSTSDGSTTTPIDHRLHFAHWNAETSGWDTHEVARMGNRLYRGTDLSEQDYTGNAALVPGDPSTIYVSTPYDPRDPSGATFTTSYEIYRGVTPDGGMSWNWTAITENSVVDNLRPIVPDSHGDETTVIWFRGRYTTAHNIDATIVGIVDRGDEQLGPVNYVDASETNTTRADGGPIGATGPSSGAGANDGLWHERVGFGNGNSVFAARESGTENAATLKTTIEGVADGLYDVFAYFWSDDDEDWRIMAGLESNNLIDFRRYGSQHAEADQFASIETVTANNNDLLLYRAYLGRTSVAGGGTIEVFIDDWATAVGGAIRTWYDGVGYALAAGVSDGLAGDFNGDFVVDAADYSIWRDNLGAANEDSIANNGDGQNGVDTADYEIWKESFGESLQLGSAADAAVPEPALSAQFALVACCTSWRRSRRRAAATICGLIASLISALSASAVGTLSYISPNPSAGRFHLSTATEAAPLFLDAGDYQGVRRVATHLQSDIESVTGHEPRLALSETPTEREVVLIGTLGESSLIDQLVAEEKLDVREVEGQWEAFLATVVERPFTGVDRALVIAGSDKRGTIYGMYDLAAQIGVSPWHWWADVPVKRQPILSVLAGRHVQPSPKVKYRGIFINDEAPALAGWMYEKFGGHNHKFYDHVYQLILRLKGNYLWPAMWGRSLYDDDPESPKLADEYGIVIGTSHHEPMMRAHVEWERYGRGPWNYDRNEAKLREFWTEGVQRMGTNESVVTIGMRGDGDEPMSETANIALLEKIVADQRKIIAEVTGKQPGEVPQMWALYKEVQEYYDRGMRVPDDVTLLLCDDNWGNLRKLPKLDERPRAGGYGIYYHFDYVGGPRNYKWLNTNSIPRVWEQMHLAYEYGADRLWIVNVGDIKPMELPTEFFLDYAWNPEAWPVERLPQYTRLWAAEQFGEEHAAAIADVLDKYTRFNARRKPELLAPETYSLANYREAELVVADFNALDKKARQIGDELPAEYQDAYFQLVQHPVEACANLNELYVTVAKNRLYAKQGRSATNLLAARARELFEHDAKISQRFNREIAGGKWNHMMDQTHIGYTYWQEPPENSLPKVEQIELPQDGSLGISVEGSNEFWPDHDGELELPALNAIDGGRVYFEVFNRGSTPIECEVTTAEPWVRIELEASSNESATTLRVEQRYWVNVDWERAPSGSSRVPIMVSGPAGAGVTIVAVADNNASAVPQDFHGHVETNGYVAIEAQDFDREVGAAPIEWQVVPGLGRRLSGVMPTPVTAASQKAGGASPHLEYRVLLSTAGPVEVQAFVSPTLNFRGDTGLRYAVSFDDQPPQIVNIHDGENLQLWEKWVADNINVTTTNHDLREPGEHSLKFWMIDPGIVLQRLVVDAGGVRPSYMGPPASTRWPKDSRNEQP